MVIHALIKVRGVERKGNEMVLHMEDLADNVAIESFGQDALDPEFYTSFNSGRCP